MVKLTDTHCHLDFEKFDADRNEVLNRSLAAGVERILIPGITLESSRLIVKLAENHPILQAAIGVHPNDALSWDNVTIMALRELATNLKVVAIGEIGLDYYWDSAPHDYQQKIFQSQLELASELGLPVVIHMREKNDSERGNCAEDLVSLLAEWVDDLETNNPKLAKNPGVMHSFSGSIDIAEKVIQLGFFIGINGPVTYQNAKNRQQICSSLPLEKILIETDAPFLPPHPFRGQRNEPANVRIIADKIAQLHSCDLEEVASITTENANRLFSWGGTN